LLKTTFAQNNIFSKQHLLKTTFSQNNTFSKQHSLKKTFAQKRQERGHKMTDLRGCCTFSACLVKIVDHLRAMQGLDLEISVSSVSSGLVVLITMN
jgi:hypothetical protein